MIIYCCRVCGEEVEDTGAELFCPAHPADVVDSVVPADPITTLDGGIIATTEVWGEQAGQDIGRFGIFHNACWVWYGGNVRWSEARRQAYIAKAQTMTALDFDRWFDESPEAP